MLRVEQTNRGSGTREHNERLLVVPSTAARVGDVHDLRDLSARTRLELEHFVSAVVAFEGKDLTILDWGDRDASAEGIELATER